MCGLGGPGLGFAHTGVYATVRFDGPGPQRLRARAPEHVVYVDSLSKTIGGGLRVGWLAATGELRRRLTDMKLASDYHTGILVQHLAHRWLLSGSHERHIKRVNPIYAARADALLEALERRLGDELRPLRPRGGHRVWAGCLVHARWRDTTRAGRIGRPAAVILPPRRERN